MLRKQHAAIAIGNFDGFHKGHQKIVRELKKIALQKGYLSVILTFRQSPRVFRGKKMPLIFTQFQKEEILSQQNLDSVRLLDFREVADLDGREFIDRLVRHRFALKHLVVGRDFRFGRNRLCGIDDLLHWSEKLDFRLTLVDEEILDGVPVSSSRIRVELREGRISSANRLLGREYYIDGRVVPGSGRGRKLGFPTLNLETRNNLLPEGVFATKTKINGRKYNSITNIGYAPTFSGDIKKIESHVINFNKTVYNEEVRLYFLQKLRDESRFNSKSELIAQIRKDMVLAGFDNP